MENVVDQRSRWLCYSARALALIWACWWTLFGLLAGMGEGYNLLGILRHAAVPGLVFLVAAVFAWRWEAIGGVLLLLAGLGTLVVFWFAHTPEGLLTLTLPPLVAGLLLIASWLRARRPGTPPSSV
jgi:hypothetical protein